MAELFVYGTLMCEEVMAAVAGRRFPSQPAQLPGYRCAPIRGEIYPGIVPQADSMTRGRLCTGLSRQAMTKLDRFEGEMYRRQTVEVSLPDGSKREAWTYVLKPKYARLLADKDWDFDAFCKHHKRSFLKGYAGFR
jgi:gamma-glutamylcyclotransferase (GGCT)/AIG2-like uncharacterized protein YtfP